MSRRTFIETTSAAALGTCVTGCFSDCADRLGVCSWSFRLPLDGVAAEMKKMGLKRIHLALQPFLEGESRHGAAEGAGAWEKVKERFASGEWVLSATMIGFPQEDYTTLGSIMKTGGVVPDDVWESNKKIVKAGAKLSAELKSPMLTLHAGTPAADAASKQKFADRVKFVVDTCGEAGVGVAFETGQETAEELAEFLQKMPGVGVNFDPANMILYDKGDPVAAVKILAPWIRHIHIKDAKRTTKPGEWGTEVPWGDGEVNPSAFFTALKDAGYTGAFAIEREAGDNRVADIALAATRYREISK